MHIVYKQTIGEILKLYTVLQHVPGKKITIDIGRAFQFIYIPEPPRRRFLFFIFMGFIRMTLPQFLFDQFKAVPYKLWRCT